MGWNEVWRLNRYMKKDLTFFQKPTKFLVHARVEFRG